MSLCLAVVLLILGGVLELAKKLSQDQEPKIVANRFLECDLGELNPLKPLHSSLWWLPDSLLDTNFTAYGVMLKIVLISSLLIMLSPLLVFGHWAAFYSYFGRSPSNTMAYVARTYEHFFGILFDADFYVPDILNSNFNDITEWAQILRDIPSFDALPPAAMIEGSAVFSAFSLLLSLIKPFVCLLSFIFSIIGMAGRNKKVAEVAESYGSYEGIFKGLVGREFVAALESKGWDCKLDAGGKSVVELRVPDNTILDIGVLANCKSLERFRATGAGITGKNTPARPSLVNQSADDASANVPNVSQVTSLSWPIAMRYRYLTYAIAEESLVSFPHRSFAAQSADSASANVPNDSQVIFLFWPIARRYRDLMYPLAARSLVSFQHPSFADQSADDASVNVPNVAQVTYLSWLIAMRYRYLTHVNAEESLVSFPHPPFADQSADDVSGNVPQVASKCSEIVRNSNISTFLLDSSIG
jgi:hypothetical protein